MIVFSWTFTPSQIRTLRDVAAHTDSDEKLPLNGTDNSWFLSSVRRLLQERLVTHTDVPVTPRDSGMWRGPTRPKWVITEKGRIVLKLAELEILDQREALQLATSPRKKIERKRNE